MPTLHIPAFVPVDIAPVPALSRLAEFPNRDHLIRHLVGRLHWPLRRVAKVFGLTHRSVQTIAAPLRLRLALLIDDPERFTDRDDMIRHLVHECRWPRESVAAIFGLSMKQVQRITNPDQARPDVAFANLARRDLAHRGGATPISRVELQAMLNDVRNDPYMTPEQREAATLWLEQGCPARSA